jgi:outer membrane protein
VTPPPITQLAVALATAWLHAPAAAITLEEAILAGTTSGPEARAAEAAIEAGQARLDAARATRLPHIALSGQYAMAGIDYGQGGARTEPRSARLTADIPLDAGGRIAAGERAADAGLSADIADAAAVRARLRTSIATAYMAIISGESAASAYASAVVAMRQARDDAAARFEEGDMPASDLALAEARLAASEAGQALVDAELFRARAEFEALTGHGGSGLTAPDVLPEIPGTAEETENLATGGNARLRALRAAEARARAGLDRAEAERSPQLSFGVTAFTVRDEFLAGYRSDGAQVAVQGRMPIFSGGETSARIREARAELSRARAMIEAAERSTAAIARSAFENVRATRLQLQAALVADRAAALMAHSVEEEYAVGERPVADRLNARQERLGASLAAAQARADHVVAVYRLLEIVGR